jgi:HPt (histidine-containing phosphotransfer) domain-containing protein
MTERLERAIVGSSAMLLREVHTLADATRSVGLLQVSQAAADIEHAMQARSAAPPNSPTFWPCWKQELRGLQHGKRRSTKR